MATKKTTTRRPASDAAAEDAASDVLAILAEFGNADTDAMVHLMRAQSDSVGAALRFGYLETFEASSIPEGRFLQLVRDQYGGGRYQVKITREGQPARFRNFSIDETFNKTPPAAAVPSEANAELLDTIRELRAEIRAGKDNGGTSLKDVFEMATIMNSNTTDAIKVALDMAKPRESEPMSEILATLRELRSFEAEGRPSKDDSPGYLGVFERLGLPLLERLQAHATATPEAIAPMNNPQRITPAAGGDWLTTIEAYLPVVVNAADLPDSDPTVYAEMLHDQVRAGGDHALATLENVLQQPGYRGALSERFPVLQKPPARAQWFAEFLDALEGYTFGAAEVCGILGCTLPVNHDEPHNNPTPGGEHDADKKETTTADPTA